MREWIKNRDNEKKIVAINQYNLINLMSPLSCGCQCCWIVGALFIWSYCLPGMIVNAHIDSDYWLVLIRGSDSHLGQFWGSYFKVTCNSWICLLIYSLVRFCLAALCVERRKTLSYPSSQSKGHLTRIIANISGVTTQSAVGVLTSL